MNIGAVGQILMGNGHMQVVAPKDHAADVKGGLVHLHRLADGVNIEQVEAIIQQCIGVLVMLHAKLVPAHNSRYIPWKLFAMLPD